MSELSEASGFDDESGENSGVYKLTKCGHMLHTPCVKAYIENSSFSQVITFVVYTLAISTASRLFPRHNFIMHYFYYT